MTTYPAGPRHQIAVKLFEPPSAVPPHQRILLLKLDHIGDFVTAIPAFRTLRAAFAKAEITLICLPSVTALAASTGLFDHVAGFAAETDSRQLGKVPRMDSGDLAAQFAGLLSGRYFLAVDFKHDASSRLWLDQIDADLRAGFAAPTRKGLDILLPAMEWDVPVVAVEGKNLPLHAEPRLTLLAHLIIESLIHKKIGPGVFALPDAEAAEGTYQKLQQDPRLKIGLCVGAGSELRQWSENYWAVLLERLLQSRDSVLIFFGGPADQQQTQTLIARLSPDRCIDLTSAMPLMQVPAHISLLDAYIGCDTGLTHMAAALGIPTVNIFAGISNVSVWRARGPRVKTVYAEVICAPCHLRYKQECPNGNICMTAIVPDIVYACFEQVIASPDKSENTIAHRG